MAKSISILAVLADRDVCVGVMFWMQNKISILAVLADRDTIFCNNKPVQKISILAVLADRDVNLHRPLTHLLVISILAVLADRDRANSGTVSIHRNFNPRGPCGPRPPMLANTGQ